MPLRFAARSNIDRPRPDAQRRSMRAQPAVHEQLKGAAMGRAPRRRNGANALEDRLLDAVGAIYEAALAPELWPDALSRVSQLCGAHWAIFSAIPFASSPSSAVSIQNPEADPEQLARMIARFTDPKNNPAIPVVLAAPPGRILRRASHFADPEWERTEIYQQLYRPFGVHDGFAAPLLKTADHFVPFGTGRAKHRGRFEPADLAAFARLVPHLQRAMQVMLRLDTLTVRAGAMAAAWDRLPHGVILLDGRGRILWSNRAGEGILAAGRGLSMRAGALHSGDARASAGLARLIEEAARIGSAGRLLARGALAVPRQSPARPLSVLVAPFRFPGGETALFGASPAVVVLVGDPDQRRELPEEVLIRLFGLTRAEAAIAARIGLGMNLKRAAGELGIAATTARQHLQRVLAKTGTHRQGELVRLLLAAVPPEALRIVEGAEPAVAPGGAPRGR